MMSETFSVIFKHRDLVLQNRALDCIHAEGGLFEGARKHQPRENTQEEAAARATEFARVRREREAATQARYERVRARAQQ